MDERTQASRLSGLSGLSRLSRTARRWLAWSAAFVGATSLLVACGGGSDSGSGSGGTTPPPGPAFELRLGSESVPVQRASSGLLRVRIERRAGFGDAIELKLAEAPAGVGSATVVAEAGETEAQLPLRVGADVPLGPLAIVVRGSAGTTTTTTATASLQLEVQPAQPSSHALIQAALDAGRIDLGTSLLHRVQAVFGSSKLPAGYVGSGPAEDLAVFADIERERPNLPPAILDQLRPFLVRPADPASVFNAGKPAARTKPGAAAAPAATFADRCPGERREWISLRSATQPVRAFALCLGDAQNDLRARGELLKVIAVVDKAYGLMVANMGPAKPDLWGDSAIDVYVVPPGADAPRELGNYAIEGVRGLTPSQPPYAGRTSSGYVMLPRWRLAQNDYFFTVIHELFHVLQFAHNYKLADHWFGEATASWASIHFNRAANIDRPANKDLHNERFGGFQGSAHGLLNTAGQNEYYSYAWPLFMEQVGGAARIGGAWAALGNASNNEQADDAIDGFLPFRTHFRSFALRNLNQEYGPADPLPRAMRYVSLEPPDFFPDGELLPKDAVKSKSHDIAPGPKEMLNFGRAIEPLSAVYFELTVTDATLKKVVFDLSGLRTGGLDVDALVLIDTKWEAEPRNLSDQSELTFCLDDPKERLWRIVFIVSNHQKRAGSLASAELGVTGSTEPCNTIWVGSTSMVVTNPGFEATISADVVFEFDVDAPPSALQQFRLRSGNWSYRTRQEGPCPINGQALGPMIRQTLDLNAPGSTVASLNIVPFPAPARYGGMGSTAISYREVDCRGEELTYQTVIGWFAVSLSDFAVSEDGNKIEGSWETSDPGQTVRHVWSFSRSRR